MDNGSVYRSYLLRLRRYAQPDYSNLIEENKALILYHVAIE